jgi:hypothetical protein
LRGVPTKLHAVASIRPEAVTEGTQLEILPACVLCDPLTTVTARAISLSARVQLRATEMSEPAFTTARLPEEGGGGEAGDSAAFPMK